jgi:anti-anti-sigma regulatory factor
MPTSLALDTTRRNDGRLTLIAVGEIDLSNIDAFSAALDAAIPEAANSGGTLTVDLCAVEYLDSSAINTLFACVGHIRLIVHPLLLSALTITGLTELVTIEPAPPTAER